MGARRLTQAQACMRHVHAEIARLTGVARPDVKRQGRAFWVRFQADYPAAFERIWRWLTCFTVFQRPPWWQLVRDVRCEVEGDAVSEVPHAH